MRVPRQNGSIIARRGRGIFLCLFQKKWWLGRTWSISHASNCSRATIKLETKSTVLSAVDDSNFFYNVAKGNTSVDKSTASLINIPTAIRTYSLSVLIIISKGNDVVN